MGHPPSCQELKFNATADELIAKNSSIEGEIATVPFVLVVMISPENK